MEYKLHLYFTILFLIVGFPMFATSYTLNHIFGYIVGFIEITFIIMSVIVTNWIETGTRYIIGEKT